MTSFLLIIFTAITMAFLSMMHKKKFLLSILLCLESILLNLLILNFMTSLLNKEMVKSSFSLFMVTLSAMEASMGISLLTLMSRKFSEKKMKTLKSLKM